MNTPPKKRRYDQDQLLKTLGGIHVDGSRFYASIHNPRYAICLADVVSEFVHLESKMVRVLAALLGMKKADRAGYIWRSVMSPRGRIDMLRTLLQQSPENMEMPDAYDRIINDFDSINARRNDFVHGQWFTRTSDRAMWLAKLNTDPHGLGWFAAKPIKIDELKTLARDMRSLTKLINQSVQPNFWYVQNEEHLPPANEPNHESDGPPHSGKE